MSHGTFSLAKHPLRWQAGHVKLLSKEMHCGLTVYRIKPCVGSPWKTMFKQFFSRTTQMSCTNSQEYEFTSHLYRGKCCLIMKIFRSVHDNISSGQLLQYAEQTRPTTLSVLAGLHSLSCRCTNRHWWARRGKFDIDLTDPVTGIGPIIIDNNVQTICLYLKSGPKAF